MLTVLAVVAGAVSYQDIELFGKSKKELLKKILSLPCGIPSHDTIERVFASIEPSKFQECFVRWVSDLAHIKGGLIAIDGKQLRRSYDKHSNSYPIHMVSAWANENGLVLGQLKISDKNNEITAIPKLLEMLDICGSVISIDAMGCQKEIAKKIISKEADYILAVKGNQATLREQIKTL